MKDPQYLAILGTSLTVAGFLFGVYQYWRGQVWKRSEFAADQLRRLQEDEMLAMCCWMLDSSARKLSVSAQLRVFTDKPHFVHEVSLFVQGLKPENERESFEWPLIAYRDGF